MYVWLGSRYRLGIRVKHRSFLPLDCRIMGGLLDETVKSVVPYHSRNTNDKHPSLIQVRISAEHRSIFCSGDLFHMS